MKAQKYLEASSRNDLKHRTFNFGSKQSLTPLMKRGISELDEQLDEALKVATT